MLDVTAVAHGSDVGVDNQRFGVAVGVKTGMSDTPAGGRVVGVAEVEIGIYLSNLPQDKARVFAFGGCSLQSVAFDG